MPYNYIEQSYEEIVNYKMPMPYHSIEQSYVQMVGWIVHLLPIPNVSVIFSHLEFWNENRKIGINFQFSQNKINLYYLGHNTPVCNHSVFNKLYLAAILENRPSWPSQKYRIGHNLASN